MNCEYRLAFKDFNQSLRKNKLLGLKCGKCGGYTCPPKLVCHECGDPDVETAQLQGEGKIVTFTSSYLAGQGREVETPILIIMVELTEGPWILGNLVGFDPDKASIESLIGKQVTLSRTRMFPGDDYSGGEEVQGGIARPTFTLTS
jgi:hypothetical protein